MARAALFVAMMLILVACSPASVVRQFAEVPADPTRRLPTQLDNETKTAEAPPVPTEPFSASWTEPPHERSVRVLRADSGACLQPRSRADGFEPYDEFILKALGIPKVPKLAALIVMPSFSPPWALTLVRRPRGTFALRVTRLSRDVWAKMMSRMRELQGPSVDLSESEQRRALSDVTVDAATVELPIDSATANLLATVWRALVARTQPVESDVFKVDGTGYSFVAAGGTGIALSPDSGTILERATYVAERLSRFVESPSVDDQSDLAFVRDDLKDALARTRAREPCLTTLEES